MFSFESDAWQEILDYWFTQGSDPAPTSRRLWFRASAADDAQIDHRFGALVTAALQRELVEWERHAPSRLALIVLLDQFPRHIYRGEARAFAGDHRAATLAVEGLSRRMDQSLPAMQRVFFYMPLMHAEDEDLQRLCLASLERLSHECDAEYRQAVADSLRSARQHQEIITRFGRFPHRNDALGRASTAEEMAFLEASGSFGQ
ncbi:hypothetical protein A11A3_10441 [Alcanivorax hongdengensis A-11-3]|uniref:Transmembrane protein n=1 Tax=Alcanivorax hongdengensis A-11-3 TaxID=1177179 RepID=L0WE36_9GAMM|nr:DUF924 family protein [Alcanivorax hongdengensis]EKF74070.1 hypothetical protein A11A3_10441 [Alcanivorax hongdengensis A-11-3]